MLPPLLLGHRGARADKSIPENTLPSFDLCLAHGCDGFEFDVRLSADGEAVIAHDARSRGRTISRTQARDLDLPTLRDVLQRFASRAFLDIELKVAGLEQKVAGLLHDFPLQRSYVVSSFLPAVLHALHAAAPEVPLGLICEKKGQLAALDGLPASFVMLEESLASEGNLTRFGPARVMVWTVNRESRMRRYLERGVAGIISDKTATLGNLRAR